MDLHQRIAHARSFRGLSQSQLALMMGVSRGACGQWEQGVSAPKVTHLAELATHLDIRFEWLATGRGDMEYSNKVKEERPSYTDKDDASTAELRAFVSWAQRLPAAKRRRVIRLIKNLVTLID